MSSGGWSEINHDDAAGYVSIPRSTGMNNIRGVGGSPRSPAVPVSPTPRLPSAPRVPFGRDMRASSFASRDIGVSPALPMQKSNSALAGLASIAGSSHCRGETAGLGLRIDNDMDPATMALIAQLQEEEAEEEAAQTNARRRQLMADEELARREQRAERDVWEVMQQMGLEQARARTAQIEEDERRAREVEAEEVLREQERQLEEERALQEAARTAWEAEQREAEDRERDDRHSRFAEDRRQRAQHFRQQGGQGSSIDSNTFDGHQFPSLGRNSATRRTSDVHFDASRQHNYPTHNPIFQNNYRPVSPQPSSDSYSPSQASQASMRSPAGFINPREDAPATSERNHDPRFRQMSGRDHPGQRMFTGIGAGSVNGRQNSRTRPFAALNTEPETLPSLQNTRSLDNLRPFSPQTTMPRPSYDSMPPRSAVTPGPGTSDTYRSSSVERGQDGRYPEVSNVRASPSSPKDPYVTFPSPQPHNRTGSSSSLGYLGAITTNSPPVLASGHLSQDGISTPGSSSSAGSRRPWTAGTPITAEPRLAVDEWDPPNTAHAFGRSGPEVLRSRRGSASASEAAYRDLTGASPRRASHAGQDQRSGHAFDDSDGTWLAVPTRADTGDSAESRSTTGTIDSQRTLTRLGPEGQADDEDSGNTAKADEWARLQQILADAKGALRPSTKSDEDDEEEATLFLPSTTTSSNVWLPATLRHSNSKPHLFVETSAEGIFRPKSEEWHVRPDPEALYERLDQAFPDLDLDKPFVDGSMTTPTTPAAESPSSMNPPLPHSRHSSQQTPSPSPKGDDKEIYRPMPPPLHPSRNELAKSSLAKVEHRKSIRLMAEHKRRTLFKDVKNVLTGEREKDEVEKKDRKEDEKPKRRLSMWGHRIQEVTPSRLSSTVPATIPESPATEDKPRMCLFSARCCSSRADLLAATLKWIKGELIGRGSYGRVYLALNVSTGDMMAVKQVDMLTINGVMDRRQEGMVEALKSEISLLKDLYHHNIVAYLGE